jgi:hypothetical protein
MSISELERLVGDAKKDMDLVGHFKLLGHDTGAFVTVANKLGYKISDDDVNKYILLRAAAFAKTKAGARLAAQGVTAAVTVAVGVQTVAGVTTVGGAVEVAVVVAGVVVVT